MDELSSYKYMPKGSKDYKFNLVLVLGVQMILLIIHYGNIFKLSLWLVWLPLLIFVISIFLVSISIYVLNRTWNN